VSRAKPQIASAWDLEYTRGRYQDEPPLPFVDDVVKAARDHALIGEQGLYIGCGNGRNYLPLVANGLDLTGLDVSQVALSQLRRRLPERQDRLIHGDLNALPPEATYPIVVGIQVFQHGNQAQAHDHLRSAQKRLTAGGLFCLRVNAVGTDVIYRNEITERDPTGAFTIRYLAGPKQGLEVHFFAEAELEALFSTYLAVVRLRLVHTEHEPAGRGHWSQWEAIWKKP
jgi:hypothetical protein